MLKGLRKAGVPESAPANCSPYPRPRPPKPRPTTNSKTPSPARRCLSVRTRHSSSRNTMSAPSGGRFRPSNGCGSLVLGRAGERGDVETRRARVILIDAIRQAHRWLDNLISDPNETVEAIASREGKTERSIRMTLSLAFLAPDIVKAAIDGRLPRGFGLKRLVDLPTSWSDQGGCWVSERRRVPKRGAPCARSRMRKRSVFNRRLRGRLHWTLSSSASVVALSDGATYGAPRAAGCPPCRAH